MTIVKNLISLIKMCHCGWFNIKSEMAIARKGGEVGLLGREREKEEESRPHDRHQKTWKGNRRKMQDGREVMTCSRTLTKINGLI